MIIMSGVNGTPRSPNDPDDRDYHGEHAGGPHDPYNDDIADQPADQPADDYDREPTTLAGRLWRAFLEWVDTYAWTIIILGIALILLDVLLVLVVLIYQVSR